MSTAPTAKRPGTGLLSSGIEPNVTCNYCKKPDMSRMNAENSKERRNNAAMTDRIPRKNIQNVQLATKRTTHWNDVGKALEPISSPKTLKWRTPQLPISPPAKKTQKKQTTSILKNPKKTRFATTPDNQKTQS